MSYQNSQMSAQTDRKKIHVFGKKKVIWHQIIRRSVQVAVLGFIGFLAIQHVVVGENGPAITASPEAFCPFGGLETLYKFMAEGGTFVSHTHLSNVVLLIAVLLSAFLLRSSFCGWICPFGFIQDLISNFRNLMRKVFPALNRTMLRINMLGARFSTIDRILRYIKYLVLVWAIGGSAYFGTMVFRDYDPWAALLNIAEFSFTPGVVILTIIVISSFFIDRPWCRYACPLGAVSGIVAKISPTYLMRDRNTCTSCKICTKTCPMGLEIHSANTIKNADCIGCLECVGACPSEGALVVKIGSPFTGK
ncbi:4Fe-4S binding protein [Leptolinea tardivitalis]|uniref:4Fe-4S ferredoxin-type domain-containing protein n=1 Tax=Leptolinea tardivitalis TaxID=229920 RepID=A0A0P6WS11_9CHLR|nr:4Fe-4S binding protein [Leptolinea tardivitalis]KPL72895.1 hypothetical protein ADM99_07565 [Leptolinea tardivitalis]GAP20720.1 protein containing 4Fe-4S dicluster domain [Leptolinea tardivitalis]